MNWRDIIEIILIGGLTFAFLKFARNVVSMVFSAPEPCSFENAYQSFRGGGKISCYTARPENPQTTKARTYGASNELCHLSYEAFLIEGDHHEYLEIRTHIAMGRVLLHFVNEKVDHWSESDEYADDNLAPSALSTSMRWRMNYVIETVRDAVKAYEERQILIKKAIQEKT